MTVRLIDADRLKSYIDCGHLRPPTEVCFSELDVCNMIDKAPTVSAEAVQGWIPVSDIRKLEDILLMKINSFEGTRNIVEKGMLEAWKDVVEYIDGMLEGGDDE